MRFDLRKLGLASVLSFTAAACSGGSPSSPPEAVAGMGGGGSGGGTGLGTLECKPELRPSSPLSLLTRAQYNATMAELVGDRSQPAQSFPPESQVAGFNNNTEVHLPNPLLVEKYLGAAEGIAARAVAANLATLAPCAGTTEADLAKCGREFVATFGKRAFRRPLAEAESLAFETLFSGMHSTRGYSAAVELTIQAVLQSPQFLYRIDTLKAPTAASGAVALDPYQLASRLSYFLLGSMPDRELFAAADAGQLASDAEIETQARRLVESEGARRMVRDFNQQWLKLDQLEGLARNPPEGITELKGVGADYRESMQLFLDRAYWEHGDLRSLFLSPVTFVNARLAPLFGAPAPESGFSSIEGAPGRVGLLTQPALMAMLAHSDQSGPVQRGVFLRQRILCLDVQPPPPGLNPVAPDPAPGLTTRARFAVHTKSAACAGCHKQIDGAGFGFENYDQLGRYRTEEYGIPVDATGNMVASGDPSVDGPYTGLDELSQRLAGSPRVEQCLATNWYRYAMGRVESAADACSLLDVQKKFTDSKGQFKELLVAVTLTDAFRYRPATPEEQ